MQQRPPFAILVPYYSNLAYLRQTLDSVAAQTDPGWWCIVVDDSPDGAGVGGDGVEGAVKALADDRVSCVRNPEPLGVAGNFNRCFELAVERGAELAVILHADDLLEPSYVSTMRSAHQRMPDATCIAPRVAVIDAEGRPAMPLPDRVKAWLWPRRLDRLVGEPGLTRLLRGQFFYCPAVSYRMDKVEHPAWDMRWGQVMDLMLYGRVLLADGTIGLEQSRVFRYRRHRQSQTQLNSVDLSRTVEEIAAVRELAVGARGRGWFRAARAADLRLMIRLQSVVQGMGALGRRRPALAWQAFRLALRTPRSPKRT